MPLSDCASGPVQKPPNYPFPPICHQPISPNASKVMFQQCTVLSPAPLHIQKGFQFTQQDSVPHKPLMPDICSCDTATPASLRCPYTPLKRAWNVLFWQEHTPMLSYLNHTACLWFPFKTQLDAQLLRAAFPDHPIKALFFISVLTSASAVNNTTLETTHAFDYLSFSTSFRVLNAVNCVSVVNLCKLNKKGHTWPPEALCMCRLMYSPGSTSTQPWLKFHKTFQILPMLSNYLIRAQPSTQRKGTK